MKDKIKGHSPISWSFLERPTLAKGLFSTPIGVFVPFGIQGPLRGGCHRSDR
jgi:hypothetical protein